MADSEKTPSEPTPDATPAKRPMLARVLIVLFVGAVIGGECLIAFLYIPSTTETAALAGAHPQAPVAPPPEPVAPPVEPETPTQAEVNLGEFTVTSYQPTSNTTLRIDFRLYGLVRQSEEKELGRLIEENKHRFRDQVIVTMRSAEISDLTDAGLSLIKRKILDRTNRILGKPVLLSVVFSDFSFVEQ